MKRHIPVQIEWHPDPAQPVPVYRQILEWMYGKMESGEWPAGTRLPSQRDMARHFQVNRSTLNQALKPLLEAGVLQGRGSQGTVVASTAWSLRLPVQPDWSHYMTAGYFRANQEVVQAINTLEFDDRLVRLGTGELDPRLFPQDAFRQTMRDVADAITSLGYVEPLGMPVLRQALADYARKRGLAVSPSSILITSGSLQGLQLISAGLLRGGSTVYVEDPTYVKSLQVFQSAHLRLCGLPMDDQGLSLEALEKHLRQSSDRGNSVLYTIPTNHNPTGRTMSYRRRIQLLDLCSHYDLPIIEDGAYEELTFDGTPPPSLKSLDPGGRVLYLGSISKSLAPGLRIGWMIAPEPVAQLWRQLPVPTSLGQVLDQWPLCTVSWMAAMRIAATLPGGLPSFGRRLCGSCGLAGTAGRLLYLAHPPRQASYGDALPQGRIGWRPHQSWRYLFQPPYPVPAPVLCLYDAGRISPGCQPAGCGRPFIPCSFSEKFVYWISG